MTAHQKGVYDEPGHRDAYALPEMLDQGLLWFINTSLFHPRGYALAIEGDSHWSLHYAGEVVRFEGIDEDAKLARFEALLAVARENGVAPSEGVPFFEVAE